MDWTKIPTDLLINRTPDKDILAIVKYQLLWATLEREPTDDVALRYMSATQLRQARGYTLAIQRQVVADITSVNSHRKRQKIYYAQNQRLTNQTDGQTDAQTDGHTDAQTDSLDKIREDKIRKENKENLFVDPAGVPPKHFDASDVIQRWNAIADRYKLPKIAMLTKDRKTRLERLLKELKITPDEFFNTLDEQIRVSPFLQGIRLIYEAGETRKENKDWKSSFDFFLERGKFLKTKEGNYADPDLV